MDQRTSDIETDLKNILQTRVALAEKLQLLEQRVQETIYGTKTAALDIINHVKNTAVDLVETTSHELSPSTQAARRPWVLVGGAVALGLLAGWLDQRRKTQSGVQAFAPAQADPVDVMPTEGHGRPRKGVFSFYPSDEPQAPPTGAEKRRGRQNKESRMFAQVSSMVGEFTDEFAKERDRLQGAVLETGRTFLQEIVHIAAQSLIDALTRRPSASASRGAADSQRQEESSHTTPRAVA